MVGRAEFDGDGRTGFDVEGAEVPGDLVRLLVERFEGDGASVGLEGDGSTQFVGRFGKEIVEALGDEAAEWGGGFGTGDERGFVLEDNGEFVEGAVGVFDQLADEANPAVEEAAGGGFREETRIEFDRDGGAVGGGVNEREGSGVVPEELGVGSEPAGKAGVKGVVEIAGAVTEGGGGAGGGGATGDRGGDLVGGPSADAGGFGAGLRDGLGEGGDLGVGHEPVAAGDAGFGTGGGRDRKADGFQENDVVRGKGGGKEGGPGRFDEVDGLDVHRFGGGGESAAVLAFEGVGNGGAAGRRGGFRREGEKDEGADERGVLEVSAPDFFLRVVFREGSEGGSGIVGGGVGGVAFVAEEPFDEELLEGIFVDEEIVEGPEEVEVAAGKENGGEAVARRDG